MQLSRPARSGRELSPKAPATSYPRLAEALDRAGFDAISLEDAHRHMDLALLEKFSRKTVILGVFAIARSRVETPDEIEGRLRAALEHIDGERLMAAPDCGLGFLGQALTRTKIANMVEAARLP
ncbi:MAG: hypothetical protein R3C97_14635 [Geminicoccaceae bacterium]